MKEGYSTIFDHLDIDSIDLQADSSVYAEAPMKMFFTHEIESETSVETSDNSGEGEIKTASSLFDYLDTNNISDIDSNTPDIWKVINGSIVRTTKNVIKK